MFTRRSITNFALGLTLFAHPLNATVIEFDDDGSAIAINLVELELEIESIHQDTPLKPRKLGELDVSQQVYRKLAVDTALRYAGAEGVNAAGLDALTFVDVFTTLIHRESNYDPVAVSAKGAIGLGQVLPEIAADYGVTKLLDPSVNLDVSARYLTAMLSRFGSLELALAAYNAGPARVDKCNGIPPFIETQQYVIDIFFALGIETDLITTKVKATVPKPPVKAENSTNKNIPGAKSVWEY